MAILHPQFTLEGSRILEAGALKAKGGVIDVAKQGSRGVVGALLAAESGGDAWLMRDVSAPPPEPLPAATGSIWVQTSGTTGKPKWAAHRLSHLVSKIAGGKAPGARWLLSFNPGTFAGLQVILSAMVGGHALIAPVYGAKVPEMADIAVRTNVRNISATPSFWRSFLMALGDRTLDLKSVTLGGEPVDQALLDALKSRFPNAALRHIYATTEAGTIFSVSDGRAGFPRNWLYRPLKGLKLSVSEHDTLRVENPNGSETARHEIWDTGDVIEFSDDRVIFKGRVDAMVNVGGVKVYPETVEAHVLELPFVQDVRVTAKPSPITGHILVADILLKPLSGEVEPEIKAHLARLPRAFRPATLRFVDSIDISASGKKLRT